MDGNSSAARSRSSPPSQKNPYIVLILVRRIESTFNAHTHTHREKMEKNNNFLGFSLSGLESTLNVNNI